MLHKELIKFSRVLWSSVLIIVYFFGKVFAHMESICETVIDWVKLFQEHQQIREKDYHLVWLLIKNLHYKFYVFFEIFNKVIEGLIVHLVYLIKEGGYEIALNLHIGKFWIFPAHNVCCNLIIQITDDSLLTLSILLLIKLLSREDSTSTIGGSSLTELLMQSLRVWVLILKSTLSSMWYGSITHVSLRIDGAHFSLSPNKCNWLVNWSHIDIRNLNTLIVGDFKLLIDNLWWSFDCKWFLWWTFIHTSTKKRLIILFALISIFIEIVEFSASISAHTTIFSGKFLIIWLL